MQNIFKNIFFIYLFILFFIPQEINAQVFRVPYKRTISDYGDSSIQGSIQHYLDQAQPGDKVLLISNNNYMLNRSLTVKKGVTLSGQYQTLEQQKITAGNNFPEDTPMVQLESGTPEIKTTLSHLWVDGDNKAWRIVQTVTNGSHMAVLQSKLEKTKNHFTSPDGVKDFRTPNLKTTQYQLSIFYLINNSHVDIIDNTILYAGLNENGKKNGMGWIGGADGIKIYGGSHFKINNNIIKYNLTAGIRIVGVRYVDIKDNTLEWAARNMEYTDYKKGFTPPYSDAITGYHHQRTLLKYFDLDSLKNSDLHWNIVGNTIRNSGNNGIHVSGRGISIRNNKIDGTIRKGISISDKLSRRKPFKLPQCSRNIIISNNIVRNTALAQKINTQPDKIFKWKRPISQHPFDPQRHGFNIYIDHYASFKNTIKVSGNIIENPEPKFFDDQKDERFNKNYCYPVIDEPKVITERGAPIINRPNISITGIQNRGYILLVRACNGQGKVYQNKKCQSCPPGKALSSNRQGTDFNTCCPNNKKYVQITESKKVCVECFRNGHCSNKRCRNNQCIANSDRTENSNPDNSNSNPGDINTNLGNTSLNPDNSNSDPGDTNPNPSNIDSNPDNPNSDPGDTNPNPSNIDSNPDNPNSDPGDTNTNPSNIDSNPDNPNSNPGDTNTNPSNIDSNPDNLNSNPGNSNSNPGNTNSCTPDESPKPNIEACQHCWQNRGEPVWNSQNCRWDQRTCTGVQPPDCLLSKVRNPVTCKCECPEGTSWHNIKCQSYKWDWDNPHCQGMTLQKRKCNIWEDQTTSNCENWINYSNPPHRACCPTEAPFLNKTKNKCCPLNKKHVQTIRGNQVCVECAANKHCSNNKICKNYQCQSYKWDWDNPRCQGMTMQKRKCKILEDQTTSDCENWRNYSNPPHRDCCPAEAPFLNKRRNKCCPLNKKHVQTIRGNQVCVECAANKHCSNNKICKNNHCVGPDSQKNNDHPFNFSKGIR